jgi:phage/plasmid-like protein (TIGR03299 family)
MSHEFYTGIMLHGQRSWHGLESEVIEGTLPARDAFVRAQALFPVGKLHTMAGDPSWPLEDWIDLTPQSQAVWRPDTRKILGTVSPGYTIIPNETLLRFAESIREEVDMDTVIVLRDGAKVAFTAKIRGTQAEVVSGDPVYRNIVGYLGHGGDTGFGGLFTNTRVVCANTLGFAMNDANRHGRQFTIRHTDDDIAQIDRVFENIDMARQAFVEIVDEYKAMQHTPMNTDLYRHWLEQVYQVPDVTLADGSTRPGTIEDKPRKWAALENAWNHGLGMDIPGVPGTVYAGLNAVTQVESSGKTAGAGRHRFHSSVFGAGAGVIRRAEASARELALA